MVGYIRDICPKCKSKNIMPVIGSTIIDKTTIRSKYICNECGTEFCTVSNGIVLLKGA